MIFLLVSVAGGLGACTRYVAEYLARRRHPVARPWATVAANFLGTFIAALCLYRFSPSADAHFRNVAVTGFCGGLTTFSSALSIPLIIGREHHHKYAVLLIATTPLVCVVGYLLGAAVG